MSPSARLTGLLLVFVSLAARGDNSQPYPVDLKVGGTLDICSTGTIMCPAIIPICDDLSIAAMRDGPAGLQIVGVGPGTTLCSARSTNKLRRVYRVTVSGAPAGSSGQAIPTRTPIR